MISVSSAKAGISKFANKATPNDVYQLGLSQEDTKLVAGFGGGMGVGGTCGALAGSLAVIGLSKPSILYP